MAGKFSEPTTLDHDDVYVENLKHCAKELQQRDMIGLIEPINKYALPGYFLNSYDKGERRRRFYVLIYYLHPSVRVAVIR